MLNCIFQARYNLISSRLSIIFFPVAVIYVHRHNTSLLLWSCLPLLIFSQSPVICHFPFHLLAQSYVFIYLSPTHYKFSVVLRKKKNGKRVFSIKFTSIVLISFHNTQIAFFPQHKPKMFPFCNKLGSDFKVSVSTFYTAINIPNFPK